MLTRMVVNTLIPLFLIQLLAFTSASQVDEVNLPLKPSIIQDPNDMLAHSSFKSKEVNLPNLEILPSEKNYLMALKNIEVSKKDLSTCLKRIQELENDFEQMDFEFRKKLNFSEEVDYKVFYLRLVKHIWNILDAEELSRSDETHSAVINLQVEILPKHVKAMQLLLSQQTGHDLVDDFFQSNWFKTEVIHDSSKIDSFFNYIESWKVFVSNIDIWINGLSLTFLMLSLWTLYRFVKLAQGSNKWCHMLFLLVILLFAISCLWQWKLMIKETEVRRQTLSMTNGINQDSCEASQSLYQSVSEWFSVTILKEKSRCEQSIHKLLVEPHAEVSPMMAIIQTLSSLTLQPLELIGEKVGLLFNNFFSNISLLYIIPACLLLFGVFVTIFLGILGYGIELPFFLGGIRPYRGSSAGLDKSEENLVKMQEQMQCFLKEAKYMLNGISETAMNHSAQLETTPNFKPFLTTSSRIIEQQLEKLVKEKFSSILTSNSQRALTDGSNQNGSLELPSITEDKVDGFISADSQADSSSDEDPFIRRVRNILDGSGSSASNCS